MIGYDRFSALRLRCVFPPEVLDAARFYIEAPDEGPDDFDESYMGGSRFSEEIDGATLWFPKRRGSQVGIVQGRRGAVPGRHRGPRPAGTVHRAVPGPDLDGECQPGSRGA